MRPYCQTVDARNRDKSNAMTLTDLSMMLSPGCLAVWKSKIDAYARCIIASNNRKVSLVVRVSVVIIVRGYFSDPCLDYTFRALQ